MGLSALSLRQSTLEKGTFGTTCLMRTREFNVFKTPACGNAKIGAEIGAEILTTRSALMPALTPMGIFGEGASVSVARGILINLGERNRKKKKKKIMRNEEQFTSLVPSEVQMETGRVFKFSFNQNLESITRKITL